MDEAGASPEPTAVLDRPKSRLKSWPFAGPRPSLSWHQRIHDLFVLARAAVEEELNKAGAHDGNDANANRRQRPGQDHRANGRRATQSQVRAIHAIAHRQNVNLGGERMFFAPADYSVRTAQNTMGGRMTS